MFIVDGMGDYLNLKAGDKVALGGLQMIEEEYGVEGYPTAYSGSISVLSSGNTLKPIEVTIAELEQYGPAYVKVSSVTFPEEAEKFAAGNIAISQSGTSVNMYILAGNNIIGEDVPASADVQGCVMNWYGLKLQISSSADVFNRVPKGGEAGGDNLILNHSFEEYSCNMFGCQFEEWNMALGYGSANSTDKLDGNNSLMINASSMATVLDQGVALTDADYAAGSKFTLTLNYKVQTMPEGETLALDCYWEAAAGGDSEATEAHESDILRVDLESGSGWMSKELVTTKPAKSSNLRVRVKVPKSAKVLFDNFSLYYTPSTDPYIEVSPTTLPQFSLNIGETATKTVHIRQGNLSGKTTFYVGGKDASQFSLSASELAADQSDLDLIITYAPTSAGTHSASLIFDNASHTTILPDMISLSGTCSDPSAKPLISVTPSTLPEFEVLEGKQQKMVVTLSSVNCTDFVYARVDHISPAEHGTFTIDGSTYSKNSEATVTITFSPIEAGTYQSTLTFYTAGAENVVVTLNGKGIAKTPETIDWQTSFVWNEANPLSWMYEKFDNVKHNETLILEGWQNVAAVDARPWWGFDESKTSPVRVAASVPVSRRAVMQAAFDIIAFITFKFQKGWAIFRAQHVYGHGEYDKLDMPFAKAQVVELALDENIGKNLAKEIAKMYDLGFEGDPELIMDKTTEVDLQFTKRIPNSMGERTVIEDGRCVGYRYKVSPFIDYSFDEHGVGTKDMDGDKPIRYIGIGHFGYLNEQVYADGIAFNVDGTSQENFDRNVIGLGMSVDYSLVELSGKVNGGDGTPQAFKLIKLVEEPTTH